MLIFHVLNGLKKFVEMGAINKKISNKPIFVLYTFSYHRRFSKHSKTWSVSNVKEAKDFKYLQDLMKDILMRKMSAGEQMHRKNELDEQDPRNIS